MINESKRIKLNWIERGSLRESRERIESVESIQMEDETASNGLEIKQIESIDLILSFDITIIVLSINSIDKVESKL